MTHREALEEVGRAKALILASLAFLAWYLSVAEIGEALSIAEKACLQSLRLPERPKAGVLYNLRHDYHEANFMHLVENGVPVHYYWSSAEDQEGRFRRLSPEYWSEYCDVCGRTEDIENVRAEDFASFPLWKEDLERYDWFFQDLRAGKRGEILDPASFRPGWEYRIVDFRLYGARTLTNRGVIRAYSERFKGTCAATPSGMPAMMREWPATHANDLADFGSDGDDEGETEQDAFFESTIRAREMVKNKWAPRPPNRTFNSFNGRLNGPEPPSARLHKRRRSLTAVEWAREMASEGHQPEAATSLSADLRNSGSSKRSRASSPGGTLPSEGGGFRREYQDLEEEGEITEDDQAGSSVPGAPNVRIEPYENLQWDESWLGAAVLVCDDDRSSLRMKIFAACCGVNSITEVMELAIRFGLPFALYVPAARVREFARWDQADSLDEETLDALYSPGYRDAQLLYGTGGAALYEQYRAILHHLLRRPHATAFIFAGGVLRFVAENYHKGLVQRLVRGPSLQVTEHLAGRKRLLSRGSGREFFIADQVSESEISLLLGHIAGTKGSNEAWLWPPPEVMESESLHMRGYLSSGAYKILVNIRNDLTKKKKFVWRTRADWKEYFRCGQKRAFTPPVIPSRRDFAEGSRLFARSFPADWSSKELVDLPIPEEFVPLARD
ncbi:hypothetical protein B0H15DRAFT_769446 [Mycena belliarum]|uniref:Uncharacterized protein n=1 Tax=Mycena belliarum TaxID=1033014 RepID=A0AAD6ULY3_9AGAR|nr:hypothetical protein B0H15DRAFT_769446 [Mycena belliae]